MHRIQENEGGHSQFEQYQTELLNPLQPDEPDIQFFTRLDAQLNKVNLFYKKKEAQYIARAKRLEQQLLTLFQVREEHERQRQRLGPKAKDQDKDDEEEDHDDEELVDSTGVYNWQSLVGTGKITESSIPLALPLWIISH